MSAKATKYLSQTTKAVEVAGNPSAEVMQAIGLAGGSTNGIAFDGGYAFSLAAQTNSDGYRLNPGLGLGNFDNYEGLRAGRSTTVSGVPEMTDTTIRAFVGNWSLVRWGFQRNFPMELIEFGDPDNTGRDLKGNNEILIRSEAVIYVAIGDLDQFAKVHDSAA